MHLDTYVEIEATRMLLFVGRLRYTRQASMSTSDEDDHNLTGRSHRPTRLHRPNSTEEVVALVTAARKSGEFLYPISRGFNWGYGSRSPVIANCALVDLSGMNRILNADAISLTNPVAVIEPGVTQEQLYQHLQSHCPGLTFNVTGSGKSTSVLGNALDRGVGYLGPRTEDIFGLEFVDGTGRVLQTGFRRLGMASPLATTHPYGIGPILDGLLSQSNFGIVTSACFRLVPRRPVEVAVSMSLRPNANLANFLTILIAMKRDGLLTSVTHVGNRARTDSTLMAGISSYLETHCGLRGKQLQHEATRAIRLVAGSEWSAMAGICGNAGQVRATLSEIRERVRSVAKMRLVTSRLLDSGYAVAHRMRRFPRARANAAVISAIRPLHGLALGIPTDVAVENLLWKAGASDLKAVELDRSNCGLIYISPALPPDGILIEQLLGDLGTIAFRYGHVLHTTVNVETANSLVAVINLLFNKSISSEVDAAHACSDELLAHLRSAGLEVYRARGDMMSGIVAGDPAYWQLIRSLKAVFDPDHVISPGRYGKVG